MTVLIVILAGLLIGQLIEYLLHRFWLHRSPLQDHLTVHHKLYHGNRKFEHRDAQWEDVASSNIYIVMHGVLAMPVGAYILQQSLELFALFMITVIGYALWVEVVHFHMHVPSDHWLEKTRLFRVLYDHHRMHHIYYEDNFGIGSHVWDYVFGTHNKRHKG